MKDNKSIDQQPTQNKMEAFVHNNHKWVHINTENDPETYRLYLGRELVVQVFPTEEDKDKGYSIAQKRYEDQVWQTKEHVPLDKALEHGEHHANGYLEKITENGPPKRLPPYLYKEQVGDHIWTTDSRKTPGAVLSQYIEGEQKQKIVEIAYIDEGGDDLAFYVTTMHDKAEEGAVPFRTLNINEALEHGNRKADEYYRTEKTIANEGYDKKPDAAPYTVIKEIKDDHFTWIHGKNDRDEEFYSLQVDKKELARIEDVNNKAVNFFGVQHVSLKYKDFEDQQWHVEEDTMRVETAMTKAQTHAEKYMVMEYSAKEKSLDNEEVKFPGYTGSHVEEKAEPSHDLDIDIEMD